MDTWENENNDINAGVSQLNVNAPVFVPGQNVFAAEFVPGGFGSRAAASEEPTDWESSAAAESTSTAATASSSAAASGVATPAEVDEDEEEDEEEEEEAEDGETAAVKTKPKAKKKAVKPEIIPESRKEPVNIVFIGHVDAGKSTIGGQLLHLTGMVDKRTLEKYEKEAKEKNRETWYLSWALDTNTEEREKGKTVECGRAHFETENKHFTLLDAPGHRSFVPNMIGGAAQADIAILVISARRGEFETGFVKDGQTREHAMLVKTAGVRHLIVLINKMDDPTVLWSEERYRECCDKLLPYLKKCGFNPKTDIHFMPCSGYNGAWLLDPPPESPTLCPFYSGPTLLAYLDGLPPMSRSSDGPLRLPIAERFKDMGVFVMGKLESGKIQRGEQLLLMPNQKCVEVMQILREDFEVENADAGENVKIKLKNVDEEEITPGFVLCSPANVCKVGNRFDAQIIVISHKSIICAGYTAVMHLHTSVEEVTLRTIICTIDKRTGKKIEKRPRFIKQDQASIVRFHVDGGNICVESFNDFPQMGRFTLRDEGKTIAIGKILKVLDSVNASGSTD